MKKKSEPQGNRGNVCVEVRNEMLYLRFPSDISITHWGVRQKYFSLKLKDSHANRKKAEEIAAKAHLDILTNQVDLSGKRYSPFYQTNPKHTHLKKDLPSLVELYDLFCENFLVFKQCSHAHYRKKYRTHLLKAIQSLPSDITNRQEISQEILKLDVGVMSKRRIINVLTRAEKWAKKNEIIPNYIDISFNDYLDLVSTKPPTRYPQRMLEKGFIEIRADGEILAFTKDEAIAIMDFAEDSGIARFKKFSKFIKFKFLTGCRTSEGIGLKWKHINQDCSEITFCQSYDKYNKVNKTTKNEKTRRFYCAPELQEMLLEVRPSDWQSEDYVFYFNERHKPICLTYFEAIWLGTITTRKSGKKVWHIGLLEFLLEAGKLKKYLPEYYTRHTFATLQLEAGLSINEVAYLLGDTVETALKHYVKARRETQPASVYTTDILLPPEAEPPRDRLLEQLLEENSRLREQLAQLSQQLANH
jgi:integrase